MTSIFRHLESIRSARGENVWLEGQEPQRDGSIANTEAEIDWASGGRKQEGGSERGEGIVLGSKFVGGVRVHDECAKEEGEVHPLGVNGTDDERWENYGKSKHQASKEAVMTWDEKNVRMHSA